MMAGFKVEGPATEKLPFWVTSLPQTTAWQTLTCSWWQASGWREQPTSGQVAAGLSLLGWQLPRWRHAAPSCDSAQPPPQHSRLTC